MRQWSKIAVSLAGLLAAGCGQFTVADRDPLTLRKPPPPPREISIVYVHGIGCHEPGYSFPFMERLAARMGLVRDPKATMQFYPFDRADLDKAADFATVRPPLQVVVPPSDEWVRDSFYTRIVPDAAARRDRYQKRLKAYRNHEEPPPVPQVIPFGKFADTCLDREKASNVGEPVNANLGPGVLVRRVSKPGVVATFYEVLWSPVSEERKRANLGYDFLAGPKDRRGSNLSALSDRALANAEIKDGVLNGGIPDAVFYAGEGKYPARKIVRTAVCMATLGPAATTELIGTGAKNCGERMRALPEASLKETIFFSESLGSRVLFDALSELATLGASAGTFAEPRAVNRLVTSPFFMFANQLPMFEIASSDYSARFDAEAWPLVSNPRLHDDKGMYEPDLLRACIAEAGHGYKQIAETSEITLQIRALRKQAALSPEAVARFAEVGAKRHLALDNQLREASQCRRVNEGLSAGSTADPEVAKAVVGMDPYERMMAIWTTQRLGEALGKPGPIGLDYYLQRLALQKIGSSLSSGDPVAVAKARQELKALTLTVYAFSDANDILSWEVSREFQNRFAMVDFRNVQRRIANPVIPLPGRAGVLVYPDQAHLNYRYSDGTLNVIMCILGEVDTKNKPCDGLDHTTS